MGETTCFMQPFSYASGGLPCDHHPLEGNPMHHALTQSISFGRFASESPSWDRWSAFPGNRYVEEAEKFSRPGSVAQKKAFFEAHYKNMAARKAAAAAAMLEQANAAAKSDCEGGVAEYVSFNRFTAAGISHDNDRSIVVESRNDCRNDPAHGTLERDVIGSHVEIPKSEFERTGESKTSSTGREDREADLVNREDSVQEEPPLQYPVSDHRDEVGDAELSESADMEKPLLKDFVQENVSEVADQKELAVVSSKLSGPQKASSVVFPSPSVVSLTPRPYWKGNIATTPIGGDSMVDRSDMKRSTPRRHPLGYLTPVREINKATTTISWRMGNAKPSSGPTKDCRTPAKTPTAAPSHATSKYSLTTPKSVNERTTPAGDGKQTGPKRRSLAKECSKFLSACKNKLQSPSLSTPFRLRTEERAARRKEKLEEKFNAERERIQLQHILKEKEEMEAKKFRQTLCFKARPLPKFYRETTIAAVKTPKKKVETNCSESSKRSRKPWSSSTMTLPNRVSPHYQGKKLVLGMSLLDQAPENRTPNIQ